MNYFIEHLIKNKKGENQKGMGLVEVLIGSAIITVGILALIQAFSLYIKYALANDRNVQAAYLGEEGLEIMGFMRDGNWTSQIKPLSTSTTYYLSWNAAQVAWLTTTTPQYVDGVFQRQITVSDVSRDINGKITSTGGTYDPNSKFITVTLKYFQGHATTTQVMSTYITNLYSN